MSVPTKVLAACCFAASLGTAALQAQAGGAPLIDAVRRGDRAAVRQLVERQTNVNAAEPDGTTPLHWAARQQDVESAALLLRSGANVAAANRYGVTALTLASISGNTSMIELLLEAGADANTALPEGETVLMTAARTGVRGAVKTLVERGAKVNAIEAWHGQTALMWAAGQGHTAVAEELIRQGADVHARSKGGLTPLLFAVRGDHRDVVGALLAAGANVNDTVQDGTSALTVAIVNARYEMAGVLLEHGANPNATDARGSALHALAFMRNPGYGANPPRVQSGRVDSLTLAKVLLERGANPNARIAWKEIKFDRDNGTVRAPSNISVGRAYASYVGATPFYLAAKGADIALMKLLVEHGADPLIPTVQKITPLMAAAGVGFWDGESPGPESGVPESQALEAVKLTLELGNDVNAVTEYGATPIVGDSATLLHRHPLNLGEFGEDALGDMRWGGSTALHGAALRGADSIVTFLVEKGARVDARNKLGWTPLMVAQGVFVANTEKAWPSTITLLRDLEGRLLSPNVRPPQQ